MRRPGWAAAAIAAVLAAGCLGNVPPGDVPAPLPDAAWARRALPTGPGHDHRDPGAHAGLSTSNFEVVGWDPLLSPSTDATPGGFICGDAAQGAQQTLAASLSYTSGVAFVLSDVTDPAAPTVVGELVLPNTKTRDIGMTKDARFVLVGTIDDNAPDVPALPTAASAQWRTPCGARSVAAPGDEVPYSNALLLVDIRDPQAPVIADAFPLPAFGAHSVFATTADGRNLAVTSVVNHFQAASYYHVHEILDTPAGPRLRLIATWSQAPGLDDADATMAHTDAWLHVHPVTGRTTVYLAHWNAGLIILELDDDALREVGRWRGDADHPGRPLMHATLPLEEAWDGRHYTFVAPELQEHPEDRPSGWLYALDTTDPSTPFLAGEWGLPVDADWGARFMFSTHYLAVQGRTAFVTLYHGGLWAVDLAGLGGGHIDLPSVGVFVPDRASPNPAQVRSPVDWAPSVMDVSTLPDGTLLAWDTWNGLFALRFHPDRPAPALPALTLDPGDQP